MGGPEAAAAGLPRPADVPSERWEALAARDLAARWGVPAVHLYEAVGSTNDVARQLAASGAERGTVVLAERQLMGRGRAGRPWDSPPGVGIWLSMIAAAPADAAAAAVLPLRVGVALARALEPFTVPRSIGLKWPNDLLVESAKLGGILCEGSWTGTDAGPVVVGVGLNVLQRADDLPPALRGAATSLRMAAGETVTRTAVADAVVSALLAELRAAPMPAVTLAQELSARDVLRGRRITVSDPETDAPRLEGLAMGIAENGALLVRTSDGQVRPVRSGTVRATDPPVAPIRPAAER